MRSASSAFNDAFNADAMHLNHRIVVELGNNRFNDGQVVTASSTKVVYRGLLNSPLQATAEFWRGSDVFNNKDRNTMKWLVCDQGAKVKKSEDGTGYRCINLDDGEYERGWWSANKSDGSGNFSIPEYVESTFGARIVNNITLYTMEGYPNMKTVTVQYRRSSDNVWVSVVSNFELFIDSYKNDFALPSEVSINGLRVYVHATYGPNGSSEPAPPQISNVTGTPQTTSVTYAGSETASGFVDGPRLTARFNGPAGMCKTLDGNSLLICDYYNNAIRKLDFTTEYVSTLIHDATNMTGPKCVAIHPISGEIWVSTGASIARYTSSGSFIVKHNVNNISWTNFGNSITGVTDLRFNAAGTSLWFSGNFWGTANAAAYRWDEIPEGTTISGSGTYLGHNGNVNNSKGIYLDEAGNDLWFNHADLVHYKAYDTVAFGSEHWTVSIDDSLVSMEKFGDKLFITKEGSIANVGYVNYASIKNWVPANGNLTINWTNIAFSSGTKLWDIKFMNDNNMYVTDGSWRWGSGADEPTNDGSTHHRIVQVQMNVTVEYSQPAGGTGSSDYARLSELQGLYSVDISDDVISIDTDEVREEYESTVPVGQTGANTFSVELDNTEQKYNPDNVDSPYSKYLGANNRFTIELGIDVNQGVGTPSYEYVQMGEFWSDEWQADGSSTTARVSGRDFSKFLQDEPETFGRVWENHDISAVVHNILLRKGFPADRIHVDSQALRTFASVWVKDKTFWEFLTEISMADQGMFGFDDQGDFYYHAYNQLDRAPYNSPVYTLDWDSNIIGGSIQTQLFLNKIKVNVSPIDKETGLRSIWATPNPQILSWAKLYGNGSPTGIGPTDTTIEVSMAPNQTTPNLQDNGWPPSGYLFIPRFYNGEVVGGELIKYKSRNNTQFLECERGYLGTEKLSHEYGAYIGEARVYNVEFDNAPAMDVKFPFSTAIDTLEHLAEEGTPQAYVIVWKHDAFGGTFSIGNTADYYTWLSGTGQTLKDWLDKESDSEIEFNTVIAGVVTTEKSGQQEARAEDADIVAENPDFIRRYGKNEIEIDNPWIQNSDHGQQIADLLISEYRTARYIVELDTIVSPALQTADRVQITNLPQLSIVNQQYHVIRISNSYDGGLQTRVTLRKVRP